MEKAKQEAEKAKQEAEKAKQEAEKAKQESDKAKAEQEAEKAKQESEKAKAEQEAEKATKQEDVQKQNNESASYDNRNNNDEGLSKKVENYSMEDFAERALNVTYKDLLRYPEKYKGECVVLTITVNNQFEDNVNQYCGFDSYSDDIDYYIFNDCRKVGDRDFKLLEKDVINVYGVFTGVDNFVSQYRLTGNEEEENLPVIDAYYIELIEE